MTYNEKLVRTLAEIISSVIPDSETAARTLVLKYGTLDRIFAASQSALSELDSLGYAGASYLRLISELLARRNTDKFKFGIKHTDAEIDEYFVARLMPRSSEAVFVMSFDSFGRAIAADIVSEGVVNASELFPRRVAEAAVKRGAASIVIAHNHPHGVAEFSEADMISTVTVAHILTTAGVKLVRHVVTAGNSSLSINLDETAEKRQL